MENRLPNFLIVGAGKSGSTSLYHYINQHPNVFMPDNKEPNFLVADYQKETNSSSPSYLDDKRRMVFDYQEYCKLFEEAHDQQMIGEATVTYLYKYEEAIPKIKKYLGADTKIIIILREPVSRTFSNYAYAVELGYENLTFREALEAEKERMQKHWASIFAYRGQTEYYEQVKADMDAFDEVLVVLTEELRNEPQEVIKKVFDFLGIKNIEIDFTHVYNPSGIPKYRWIHSFLNQSNPVKEVIAKLLSPFVSRKTLQELARIGRSKNIKGKLILEDEDLKKELYLYYKPQILKLQKLIGKDLSIWMKKYE